MAKSLRLARGAHGAVIAYLRKNGGRAIIPATELARSNNFLQSGVSYSISQLIEFGILTAGGERRRGKGAILTLNEGVLAQYVSGTMRTTSRPRQAKSGAKPQSEAFSAVVADLSFLEKHFTGADPVQDLLQAAKQLTDEFEVRSREQKVFSEKLVKLTEVAQGMDASDEEIASATVIEDDNVDGVAGQLQAFPGIPIVEFEALFNQSPKVYMAVARLQSNCRKLKNELIQGRRDFVRVEIQVKRMKELMHHLQSVETIDFTSAIGDWEKAGDRVVARQKEAIAVVATNH